MKGRDEKQKKVRKSSKKALTMGWNYDIITRLTHRGVRTKKSRKKLEKSFKNLLTKDSECDIITKPTERDRQHQQRVE